MFPDIEAQQRSQSRTYGVASVRFFGDMQFSVLSTDSHAQPEPNRPTAAALNSFLKFSKLPKSRLMASASFPVGSLCEGLGENCRKYNVWFSTCPALLNMAPSGAVATMVTKSFSHTLYPEQDCSGCLRMFVDAYRNGNLLFAD